jgi:hypothetical protein
MRVSSHPVASASTSAKLQAKDDDDGVDNNEYPSNVVGESHPIHSLLEIRYVAWEDEVNDDAAAAGFAVQYKVKWEGEQFDDTWEPAEMLPLAVIETFHTQHPNEWQPDMSLLRPNLSRVNLSFSASSKNKKSKKKLKSSTSSDSNTSIPLGTAAKQPSSQ